MGEKEWSDAMRDIADTREEGNDFFRHGGLLMAVECYTAAMCHLWESDDRWALTRNISKNEMLHS